MIKCSTETAPQLESRVSSPTLDIDLPSEQISPVFTNGGTQARSVPASVDSNTNSAPTCSRPQANSTATRVASNLAQPSKHQKTRHVQTSVTVSSKPLLPPLFPKQPLCPWKNGHFPSGPVRQLPVKTK